MPPSQPFFPKRDYPHPIFHFSVNERVCYERLQIKMATDA
jgi:hypothetical protein